MWRKILTRFLTLSKESEKHSAQQPLMTFAVLSDIHVQSGDSLSHKKLKLTLEDLLHVHPKSSALVINGDLGNGRPADYETLKSILVDSPYKKPIFFAIGNHEFYKAYHDDTGKWNRAAFPNGETDQASIERFLAFTGQPSVYYDQWMEGFHFIFLGSEQYKQTNPDNLEDAYLSQSQLTWLKLKLAENFIAGKPIFLFLHQPLPDTVAGSSLERGVVQHAELLDILSSYPEVIYFSGHTHWELKLDKMMFTNKFTMFNSSSVYQPWNEKNEPIQGSQSEGLYVEVYHDKVVVKGRDFSKKGWVRGAKVTVEFSKK